MLAKLLWAVVVFVVTWLIVWIVGAILVAIPTEPTVWVGRLLENLAVLFGLLAALLYLVQGDTWFRIRR